METTDGEKLRTLILEATKSTSPGIYPHIDEDTYHSKPLPSASWMNTICRESPLHLAYQLWGRYSPDAIVKETDKAHFRIGRAIHTAVLEPREFYERFVKAPEGIKKNTKAGKDAYRAFATEHARMTILTAEEWDLVENIAFSIRSTELPALVAQATHKEVSIFETVNGLFSKGRPDVLLPSICLDIKSTRSAKPSDFERACVSYGYHRQGAMYRELARSVGLEVNHYMIAAIEKQAPYAVCLYRLADELLDLGKAELFQAQDKFKKILETGIWECYTTEIIEIGAKTNDELQVSTSEGNPTIDYLTDDLFPDCTEAENEA